MLWIIGIGYLISFFDITNIAFGLPVISKVFHLTSAQAAVPITASLLGYILGAYLNSTYADARGRKSAVISATVLFTVGSIASFASFNLTWLIVWRFITGMGIGAEIAGISAYIGELAPAPVRGRYTSLANVYSFSGLAVVPFVALIFVPNFSWGWRAMFLVGALGGLTLLFARQMPESPRWLMHKGRLEDAAAIIADAEKTAASRYKRPLPEPQIKAREDRAEGFPTSQLFRHPYFGRLVLLVVLWFIIYTGDYTWLGLAPTFLVAKGYTLTKSIIFLVTTGIGYPIGTLLATWIGDRFERKYIVLTGLLVYGIGLLLLGFIPSGATIIIFGFLISVALAFFFPLMYAITAESFPTGARATGVALTDGVGHLGGAVGPLWAVAIYAWGGIGNGFESVFLYMGATGIIAALLLPFTISATRRSLEAVTASDTPS